MDKAISRRLLIAAAALAFAAGCSGNPSTSSSGGSLLTPSSKLAAPGMRILPGPLVAGPLIVPIVPHRSNLPHRWPANAKQILFVAANSSSEVLMYDPKAPNPSPEGSITTGIDYPVGLAVDKSGTLYVANIDNNTITIYPAGASSPSLTITQGLSDPYGIAVDSSGDIFASNLGTDQVLGYKAGATSPFETINFSSLGQPVGVAVDGENNIWVACDSSNSVYTIAAGSSTPVNSGLTVTGPIGISFGRKDLMYVSNFGADPSNVAVYTYGTKTPVQTITDGIEQNGPTLNGVTRTGLFFQSNQDENVVGYKKKATSPFSTITGISNPLGIASSPLVKK